MAKPPLTQDQLNKVDNILKKYMSNKRSWVKRYGKDAESVMRGRAISSVKKQTETMNKEKIKELVKSSLMKEDNNESSLLSDFESKLKSHDWYYMMSDDNRAYTKGSAEETELKKIAKQLANSEYNDEAAKLYDQYNVFKATSFDSFITPPQPFVPMYKRKQMGLDEKKADKDYDKDGKIESSEEEYKGVKSKAIEKAKGEVDEADTQYANQQREKLRKATDAFEKKKRLRALQQKTAQDKIEPLMREDIDLGHEDNEPHMIKGELYRIGKYAMELYGMLEEFEETGGEVDFPAWWQAKITTAMNNMVSAKHYLDFEIKEPAIDATVDALTGEESHEGEPMMEDKGDKHVVMKGNKFYTGTEFVDDIKDAMRYNLDSATMVAKREKGMVYTPSKMNENSDEETLAAKIAKALKDKANKDTSDQSNLKQARTALNKGNLDAAKKIADPYLEEKKLTKAEKKKKEDIVKGMKGSFKGDESAMYAIATAKAKKVAETLIKKLKND